MRTIGCFKMLHVVAIVLVSISDAGARSQSAKPLTNLCQISTRSGRVVSKRIEFDADLFNAMPHGIFLGDQRCPKQKLQVEYQTVNAAPSIINLDKFISRNIGNVGLIASGRFCGVVERDRVSGRLFLSLRSVTGLHSKGMPSEEPDAPPAIGQADTLLHESGHVDPSKPH